MEETKRLLIKHYQAYPDLKIRDIFKFIFQSSFGCEHLVTDEKTATEYVSREYENITPGRFLTDALDGDYSRVHLSWITKGIDVKTLGRLFFLSAVKESDGDDKLAKKLQAVRELVSCGDLPFSPEETEAEILKWQSEGFPAVHHSDAFRERYKPSYRVISNRFVPYLQLLAELDKRLKAGRVIMAVEGGCASGKSTLGEALKRVYGCTLFHADDFFLQPHQRTKERLFEVGGNLDRERLEGEVLIPLSENRAVDYRRFDCATMSLLPPERFEAGRLTVIEGVYSMHPELRKYYNFSVFVDAPEELRKNRITKRNSSDIVQRFFDEWMPMENRYFEGMSVKESCDLVVDGGYFDDINTSGVTIGGKTKKE